MEQIEGHKKIYHIIKFTAFFLGLASLLISFQLRTSLSVDGTTYSGGMIEENIDAIMAFFIMLHIFGASMFFGQMMSRVRMNENRQQVMSVFDFASRSPLAKVKVVWSGVSLPLLLSLAFYGWITILQVPEEKMGSNEAVLLYHAIFLMQVFYINWGMANYDMKLLDNFEENDSPHGIVDDASKPIIDNDEKVNLK